jgi:ParB family chromosome partitioning protein
MMRKALGRGLEALIPGAGKTPGAPLDAVPGEAEQQVAIERISLNPRQPRSDFDEDTLAELANSIRAKGVIQPLLVRPREGGGYELVAGERRLRAAERVGLSRVPVVVREVSDAESLELAVIENVQRDDLSPIEEAVAYQRLLDEFGHTQEELAERVGKSRPAVANALRLLRLPESIKRDLANGRITAGHARVLLSIERPEQQLRAARQIVARQMSVRDAERLAPTRRTAARSATRDPHLQALERELATVLGTRVRIRLRGRGGCIEIEYYSNEQLQGLTDSLRGASGYRIGSRDE